MKKQINFSISPPRGKRAAFFISAAAELIISAALFFIFRFALENLAGGLAIAGKIMRLAASNVAAWLLSILITWRFIRKYGFFGGCGGDNDCGDADYVRFLRISAAAAVIETLILIYIVAILSWRGLCGKAFGTAFAALFFAAFGFFIYSPHNNLRNISQKLKSVLFGRLREYKRVKNPLAQTLLRAAGYIILGLLPFYCAFMLEAFNFGGFTRLDYFLVKHENAFLFSLTVLYLIFAVLLLVFRRGGIAASVLVAVSSVFGIANYLKYSLTGDYFYPWDLVNQSGNVGELLGFVSSGIPLVLAALVVIGIAAAVVVIISKADINLKFYVRIPAALLIVVSMWATVSTTSKITAFLDDYGISLFDMALQQSNYAANGFTGAFVVNVLSMNVAEPDGYGEDAVTEIMDGYEDDDVSDDYSYPDIIVILSESFWDPTNLPGVEFSSDPLENFREIASREGTYSGYMYETGLGGGTVRPEFEVLTGLSTDYLPSGSIPWQYVTGETESYVSIYNSLGYRTIAVHPYTSSFYSRKNAYPLIGFDELYFEDSLYALEDVDYSIRGGYISDDSFIDYIEYYLEESDGTPTFLFGISMENHQPYANKYGSISIEVTSDALDEETLALVANYTEGVRDADAALGKLVDYIDLRDRDTILIYFGDHLPTLGSNLAAYVETGMISSSTSYTEEEALMLYSTPFLIYANFDLGDSDLLTVGTGNEIASYELLNAASDLIGSPKSAYMKFLSDFASVIPYYNVRLKLTIGADAEYYVNAHKMLTYDVLVGKQYLYMRR
ncbi:MAG: LTA synthase family protein [Firmicutes bacterium]|nr:LTA synthase family protein [Bacillota bacterium]MCD8314598.1 LTA synthase family protein [Bacillota bacterium]